jgi:hypothetical protein
VHNLSDRPVCIHLRMSEPDPMIELLGDKPYELIDGDREISLEPYGYRWFRISGTHRFVG